MCSLKCMSPLKFVHCNQNTNANVISKCAFQNEHFSQNMICYAFHQNPHFSQNSPFNQDVNENKLPK